MADAKIVLSAEDKTGAAFASAKRNLADLSVSASRFVANFAMIGTAVGTAIAAVGAGAAVKTLDTLDDLSEKTGIAVESLSALRYAGEVVGTPLEALATSTRTLAKNMAEAAGGNKELARTFAAIGVSVKSADGSLRSQDAVLLDLADKFRKYEDGAEKAALAQKIFGKAGQEMIPLLNQGSDGIRKLREEAEALGAVYGGELARQAAEFNDNLKRMQLAGEAAGAVIAGRLLPTLNDLATAFIESKKGGSSLADALGTGLLTVLQTVIVLGSDVAFVFKGIQREIGAAAAQAAAFARGDFRSGLGIGDALQKDNELARKQLDEFQRRIMGLGQRSGDMDLWGAEARAGRSAAPARGKAPVVRDDKDAREAAEREARERAKLIAEMNGLSGSFAEDWARLTAMYKDRQISVEALTAAQATLLSKQPGIRAAAELEKKQQEELSKLQLAAGAQSAKYIESLAAQNAAQLTSNQSLAQEIEEMGLTTEALERLRLSRMDANIAREQEILLQARNIEGNDAEVTQIERRIELLRIERGLAQTKITNRPRAEASLKVEQIQQDITSSVSNGIAQALREGKNPIQAFASSLGDAVLNAMTQSIANALVNSLGFGKDGIFTTAIGGFFGKILGLADGGYVSGPGGPTTDSIPARLSNGEYVIRAGAVKAVGRSFLDAVNDAGPGGVASRGFMPMGFSMGGYVAAPSAPGSAVTQHVTIVQNFTVGDIATKSDLQKSMAMSRREMAAAVQRARTYGAEA